MTPAVHGGGLAMDEKYAVTGNVYGGNKMDKITCEDCLAWRVCPRKPKREDYGDENKYLIDLESGVWSCKDTVQRVCGENAALKERIEKMKSDVRRELSYWNSGETQYHLLQGLLDKWGGSGSGEPSGA